MAARIPWMIAAALASIAAASCSDGSSGGGDVQDAGPTASVVVNEVVAKATAGGPDWVEFFNTGDTAVDLAGFAMRDSLNKHEFVFPAGTSIAAHGHLVVECEGGTTALVASFGLGSADAVRLFDADGRAVDSTEWGKNDAPEGMSWGRSPDGSGEFATLAVPTPGAANGAPL